MPRLVGMISDMAYELFEEILAKDVDKKTLFNSNVTFGDYPCAWKATEVPFKISFRPSGTGQD